jgi:hypothetical protein
MEILVCGDDADPSGEAIDVGITSLSGLHRAKARTTVKA